MLKLSKYGRVFDSLAIFVLAVGCVLAFGKGGQDFNVFYHAWGLAIEGRGNLIYVDSPDRFLYAPGFAWLLCPLSLLPFPIALALWNVSKAAALFMSSRSFAKALGLPAFVGSLSLLFVARPLLIDLQYGQVNGWILALALTALPLSRGAPLWKFLSAWFFLTLGAVAKLFALPLLGVPLIRSRFGARRKDEELPIYAILAGLAIVLLLPFCFLESDSALLLFRGWVGALQAKGLPLETHNQSFSAVIHRVFSGAPSYSLAISDVLSLQLLGLKLLPETLQILGLAWTSMMLGLLTVTLLMAASAGSRLLTWTCLAITGVILPSHIIWKPYFIFLIPTFLGIVSFGLKSIRSRAVLIASFLLINFTSLDFVGNTMAARVEGYGVLLGVTLVLWLMLWSKISRTRA